MRSYPTVCPICKSPNIDTMPDGGDGFEVWYSSDCHDCGATWQEVYTFEFVYDLKDKDGNEVEYVS